MNHPQKFEINLGSQLPPIQVVRNPGVAYITFPLPDPDQHGVIDGEINLKWQAFTGILSKGPTELTEEYRPEPRNEFLPPRTEEWLGDLVKYMTPQQEEIFREAFQSEYKPIQHYPLNITEVSQLTIQPIVPRVESVYDPQLDAKRQRQLEALRKALGDESPPQLRSNYPYMKLLSVNYLAIIISAIAFMVLGLVWYRPLFGKRWRALQEWTPEQMKQAGRNPAIYLFSFIGALVAAYVLAMFINAAQLDPLLGGTEMGLLIGIGFVAPFLGARYLVGRRPLALYLIDVGYTIVSLIIAGTILGLLR